MSEFSFIDRYCKPLTEGRGEARGLLDDAAMLRIPQGYELAVSTDSLYETVHFFAGSDPRIVAQKALRSNISDLYASGADPYCYQLSFAFDGAPDTAWLDDFFDALLQDQRRYGLFCSGGDTSSVPSGFAMTLSVMGLVPAGLAWGRDRACAGDVMIATGVAGYGAMAFKRGATCAPDYLPLSKAVLQKLRPLVHAAVDVSDGVLSDALHIARASGVDIMLHKDDMRVACEWDEAVTGGDDYILLLTCAADDAKQSLKILREAGYTKAHIIGQVIAPEDIKNPQVRACDAAGFLIDLPERLGWNHF